MRSCPSLSITCQLMKMNKFWRSAVQPGTLPGQAAPTYPPGHIGDFQLHCLTSSWFKPLLSPWMQEISLPCERCRPCSLDGMWGSEEVVMGRETHLLIKLRIQGQETFINKPGYFCTNLLPKPTLYLEFSQKSNQTYISLSCQIFTNIFIYFCLKANWFIISLSDI